MGDLGGGVEGDVRKQDMRLVLVYAIRRECEVLSCAVVERNGGIE